MDQTVEQTVVERELEIAASPETVWEFLVDPEKSVRWWGCRRPSTRGRAARTGSTSSPATRRAASSSSSTRRAGSSTRGAGSEGGDGPNAVPPGSTTVEIELVPTATARSCASCTATCRAPTSVASHGHGWDHYLGRLAVAASGGDPGPDPWRPSGRSA